MTSSRRTISCADGYEAEKLASLFSLQDRSISIEAVVAVHGPEIVLRLKDKSSHSVVLRDRDNARMLAIALHELFSDDARIEKVSRSHEIVELVFV